MKKEVFNLERTTTLIPLTGDTEVTVVTNGSYVKRKRDGRKREGNKTLARTKMARIYISPGGNSITMSIHLPTEDASLDEYIEHACRVYGKYLRTCEMVN